jgi:hypothetical protein
MARNKLISLTADTASGVISFVTPGSVLMVAWENLAADANLRIVQGNNDDAPLTTPTATLTDEEEGQLIGMNVEASGIARTVQLSGKASKFKFLATVSCDLLLTLKD